MTGTVRLAPPPLGASTPTPGLYTLRLEDPPVLPHVCRLLDGAKLPEAVLSDQDKHIRVPRLDKGMSIVDLANTHQTRGM